MEWYKAEDGTMPEDLLKKKKYKLWGQERQSTPYVLVIDKYCDTPAVMKRVYLAKQGKWYWCDGPLFSNVVAWAKIEDAPFDNEAIAQRKKEVETFAKSIK